MTLMLPAIPPSPRSITGVAGDLFGALDGTGESLPAARSAVLVVMDGLGAIPLRAHAGHARRLAGAMAKKDVLSSVFPSTTAAALTSLLTGVDPGQHGLVGYEVRDPGTGAIVNQLAGWEKAHVDPRQWQRTPTVFETAAAAGRPAFAVGLAAYAGSGFSAATLRGAEFRAAKSAAERVALALTLADENEGALVYCYLPEADKAGHKHGMASPAWIAALEELDAAIPASMPEGVGVLVTADHGMVDVPRTRHLVIEERSPLQEGVAAIAGEPRMLHVYLEDPSRVDELAARWAAGVEGAADVLTRAQAVQGGLFGVAPTAEALSRIGDLVVPARGLWALYDGAADPRSQGMVGQHGSVSPEELRVPLIRFGAFAR
ncbi:Type I phosphodiesterase / nucleotide pyrophosphatase [Microbacterium sp. 8M]|uniref:alkaline phosphatase family protein n=1 Tax=Microbacterium sp. 8M TaxID=2653153 RepID=UPI0012F30B07|nr:nucleotide pyrophosphatase/phosphodiesterase family protein [Microbacterium sp. 8M]VXC16827.1 Type I phosphodiesterase / nucleotide pyrophosphatase [Microbacterium sp. 8M]